jgi:hypothetical protein
MSLREPRLSKSRYLTGLQCDKRLWLGWHDPVLTPPNLPGSVFAVGTDVGEAARLLFPDGVLVAEGSREFEAAQVRTLQLLGDESILTIFEAAVAHQNVVVRPDVIQRLPDGRWALVEVKSTTKAKSEHIDDLAIQTFVLRGAGLDVCSMSLIHVDRDYVMGSNGIDWGQYFCTVNLTDKVEGALAALPERVRHMQAVLRNQKPPEIAPTKHCFAPFDCEFWARCTASKPRDWIFYLPRLKGETFIALTAANIERMSLIPSKFPLTARQRAVADCAVADREWLSSELEKEIAEFGPPALYLDFETGASAIPLYADTRPYQRIPFQWSLHRMELDRVTEHGHLIADCRLPIADCRLPIADCRLPIADCRLPRRSAPCFCRNAARRHCGRRSRRCLFRL